MFTVHTISDDWQIIPAIAAFAPFVILFLGYLISKRRNHKVKFEESNTYLRMVIGWVSVSKDRTLQQASRLRTYSNELSECEYIQNATFYNEPMLFGKLNTISLEDSLKYLVTNIEGPYDPKIKKYSHFISNINYLAEVEAIIAINFALANTNLEKVTSDFNNINARIENIFYTKHIYLKQNRDKLEESMIEKYDILRKELNQSVVDSKKGPTGKQFYEILVDPALLYFKEQYEANPGNEFCYRMHSELVEMLRVRNQWDYYKHLHVGLAQNYASGIENSYKVLEECVEFYQNAKPVKISSFK